MHFTIGQRVLYAVGDAPAPDRHVHRTVEAVVRDLDARVRVLEAEERALEVRTAQLQARERVVDGRIDDLAGVLAAHDTLRQTQAKAIELIIDRLQTLEEYAGFQRSMR